MSYAISKQNFLEKAGRSTTGLDEQFTVCWANCQSMEDIVDRIRLHMVEYVESMRSLCISGHAVSEDFKSFYERIPVRLTVIAIKYENIQHGFRTDKIQLLERLVNQNVFSKLEEVKLDLSSLRTKVGDREVSRKRYEHYLEKIQELRENRIRAKNKGKDLSVSDLDKLARNEKKFEDARMEYVAVNHVVTKALWQMWSRRYAVLDPIYNEILKIQANFTQALSNQLQSIVQPLKQQMQLELPEEPVPAIFASNGATGGANKHARNGSQVDDGTDHHDGAAAESTPTSTGARTLKQGKQTSPTAPVAVKNGRANVQEPDEEEEDEDTDSEEDEEAARKKAKAKAKAAKAKAAAAAAAAAPIPLATAATLMVAPKAKAVAQPVATADEEEEEEEEEEDSEEETEEERKARKAAKKAKKEKKRQAAAAAASGKTKKGSSTDASLDFLSAVAAEIPATTKPKKGTAAAGGLDLLSFSPMKPVVAAEPAAPATAAAKKKALLDVDSFFAPAQPAMSPAVTASAPGGGLGLHVAPSLAPAASDDPFADLPSAESGPPVDLFAIPVQAIEPPRQQQQQQQRQYQQAPLSYSSQFAASPADLTRAGSFSTASSQQPGYMRAASLTPGGPNTNGLDDPLFTAPLPLPTSITPTAAAVPAAAAAAAPAKRPSATASAAATATAARRKVVQPDSDDSSSESSTDESDTEDEVEGSTRKKAAASKKAAAAKAPAAAKPLSVPVKGVPTTGGLSDIHIAPTVAAASSASAAATSSLVAPAAAVSGPRTPQQAPAPAGNGRAPAAAAALRSPEDYSPTRNTYNPHGDKKPKPEDPFGGVNEDW